jgi:hypothetical protein
MTLDATLTSEFVLEIPNKPGTLGDLSQLLGKEDVNILGFAAVARPGRLGQMHLVTDDADAAAVVLEEDGYAPDRREAVVVRVPNRPGQLGRLASKLGASGINIDASFIAASGRDDAELRCVFSVDRPVKAQEILEQL